MQLIHHEATSILPPFFQGGLDTEVDLLLQQLEDLQHGRGGSVGGFVDLRNDATE